MNAADRSSRSRPRARSDASGFTAIAILILVSLMASMAATFSRHVIVDSQVTVVSSMMWDSTELIASQTDYVLQSNRVGMEVTEFNVAYAIDTGKLGGGDDTKNAAKEMQVEELQEESRTMVFSQIVASGGLGATRLLEAARVPGILTTSPDALPTLDLQVAWDVLNAPQIERLDITSSTTLSGTVFEGIIVVHEPAVLTLDDVIVRGAILSASAAFGTVPATFSDFLAPRVIITGTTRILEADFLPGLAFLMPDGVLMAEHPNARVQIQGDVIAHTVHLLTNGSLRGNLATVLPAVLGTGVDHIGAGRGPRPWSPVLDHHDVWDVQFLAVIPRELTLADVAVITQFKVPSSDSTGGGGTGSSDDGGSGSGSGGSGGHSGSGGGDDDDDDDDSKGGSGSSGGGDDDDDDDDANGGSGSSGGGGGNDDDDAQGGSGSSGGGGNDDDDANGGSGSSGGGNDDDDAQGGSGSSGGGGNDDDDANGGSGSSGSGGGDDGSNSGSGSSGSGGGDDDANGGSGSSGSGDDPDGGKGSLR